MVVCAKMGSLADSSWYVCITVRILLAYYVAAKFIHQNQHETWQACLYQGRDEGKSWMLSTFSLLHSNHLAHQHVAVGYLVFQNTLRIVCVCNLILTLSCIQHESIVAMNTVIIALSEDHKLQLTSAREDIYSSQRMMPLRFAIQYNRRDWLVPT